MIRRPVRERLLLAVYRRTRGDLNQSVTLEDVALAIGLDARGLKVQAQQLTELGYLQTIQPSIGPDRVVRMTIRGVQEAEKMEQSFYKRLREEQPFLYDVIRGAALTLVGILVYWLFGFRK
jgi:hypothetical protein